MNADEAPSVQADQRADAAFTLGEEGTGLLDSEFLAKVGRLDLVSRKILQGRMKGEKRSGLMVHARTGLPCPVCGDTVREVSFADTSLQYCPTCQTGGKPLADRRLSKLLR